MSAVLSALPSVAVSTDPAGDLVARVGRLVQEQLVCEVVDIDVKGAYPEAFLRRLGAERMFAAHVPTSLGGLGLGLDGLIRAMAEVSKVCGSTGFLTWCQSALAWYLVHTDNAVLRARLLTGVMAGEVLGGTGLSNLMKHCSGIEELRLQAQRVDGGWVLDGVLPWVSNLGDGHWFAVGARTPAGTLLAAVRGGQPGLSLVQSAHFTALEGTRTFACQFRQVFVPEAEVLAVPEAFDAFVARIKPGFIIAQCGIALGLVEDCVAIMRRSDETHAHVNQHLDDQADELGAAVEAARSVILDLAARVSAPSGRYALTEILEARALGSELALRASMAAMLHSGAKGYLLRNPAQRRVREAIFVAIVTPALKHLRKELAALAA